TPRRVRPAEGEEANGSWRLQGGRAPSVDGRGEAPIGQSPPPAARDALPGGSATVAGDRATAPCEVAEAALTRRSPRSFHRREAAGILRERPTSEPWPRPSMLGSRDGTPFSCPSTLRGWSSGSRVRAGGSRPRW